MSSAAIGSEVGKDLPVTIVTTEEDDYQASMKRQESRTRESISRKARQAAEKLGLDEPPDDPLGDDGKEEKTEKVMERRLSVVAQRSEKSKERAEAATKWLDKQIRKVNRELEESMFKQEK